MPRDSENEDLGDVERDAEPDLRPGPLDGVRVIDLTRVVTGPFASRTLADLGADVIKIEPPGGDATRRVRPDAGGIGPYFSQLNVGKRSVVIDITTEAGCNIVRRLTQNADVLVENFRPGVLSRYGLGPDELMAETPSLIYCSISGYGQTGVWRNRRAYAPLVHAEAGTLEFAARKRGVEPMSEVQSHGDVYPALAASMSVLAALFDRSRTGRGQRLDIAMAEVLTYTNEWTSVDLTGFDEDQLFGAWGGIIAHLSDGRRVAFAGNPVWTFKRWVAAMARPEFEHDQRFQTVELRLAHKKELVDELRYFISSFDDVDTLEQRLEPYKIPVGLVRSSRELAETDWAKQRAVLSKTNAGHRVPNKLANWPGRYVGARPDVAELG